MKKIINTAPMAVITTQRTPYSILLTTKVVGNGTLTQAQDVTKNVWSPNRRINPLVIEPVFSAYDKDTDHEVVLTPVYTWYANGVQIQESATSSEDYYIVKAGEALKKGSLVVRKNVSYDAPVTIRCVATYKEYQTEDTLMLTSENNPDVFYQVDLMTPNTVEFHPLIDETSQKTFTAFVQYGGRPLEPTEQVAYFWYIDGEPITAGTLGYVSGIGTDSLTLDADYFDGATVSVRLGYPYVPEGSDTMVLPTAPNCNAKAQSGLVWVWDNVSVLPLAVGGNHITQFSGNKLFESVAKVNAKDISDTKRSAYLKTRWFTHAADAMQNVKTYYGYGNTVSIPASALRRTSGINVEVGTDIYLLGYKHLAQDGTTIERDEVQIDSPEPPVVITTKRTVLSTLLSIKEGENGTLTQYQDLSKNTWSPNRKINPLVLTPVFSAVNDMGEAETVTPEFTWYVDGTRITTTSTSADYYLESSGGNLTGNLVVRKNVGYETSVTVKCVATYTDNLRIETYSKDKSVLLTTESSPDKLYMVTLDVPNTLVYHPLTDESSQFTIHAAVQYDGRPLDPSEQMAYFWYIDGTPVTADTLGIVSGTGTDTLVIDADYYDGATVSVKLGTPYYPSEDSLTPVLPAQPNVNVGAQCGIVWDYEDPKALVVGYGGNVMRPSSGEKLFDATIQVRNMDISEAKRDKYIRTQWSTHSAQDFQDVKTLYEFGKNITLQPGQLTNDDDASMEVGVDIYVLGPVAAVVDDVTGEVVVDDVTGETVVSNS